MCKNEGLAVWRVLILPTQQTKSVGGGDWAVQQGSTLQDKTTGEESVKILRLDGEVEDGFGHSYVKSG